MCSRPIRIANHLDLVVLTHMQNSYCVFTESSWEIRTSSGRCWMYASCRLDMLDDKDQSTLEEVSSVGACYLQLCVDMQYRWYR